MNDREKQRPRFIDSIGRLFDPEPGNRPWWLIWFQAYLYPRQKVFEDILAEEGITLGQAYRWIALGGFFAGIILAADNLWLGPAVFIVNELNAVDPAVQWRIYLLYGAGFIVGSAVLLVIVASLIAGLLHLAVQMDRGVTIFREMIIVMGCFLGPVAMFLAAVTLVDNRILMGIFWSPIFGHAIIVITVAFNAVRKFDQNEKDYFVLLAFVVGVTLLIILNIVATILTR